MGCSPASSCIWLFQCAGAWWARRRGATEMACTYDIHPHGARLVSGRDLNIGDLVMVERGRYKAICQVVWAADPSSPLRGQFTVHCVDSGRRHGTKSCGRWKSSTSP